MKGQWIKVGPTEQPYCEIVADDSGMVYISVQSGAVRTSDYLIPQDAERVARAILAAVAACFPDDRVREDGEEGPVLGRSALDLTDPDNH